MKNYSETDTKSLKKRDGKSIRLISKLYIDFSIFRNNNLTMFEAFVKYLKRDKGFNYHKIALILGRDERNIWTVYDRAIKK